MGFLWFFFLGNMFFWFLCLFFVRCFLWKSSNSDRIWIFFFGFVLILWVCGEIRWWVCFCVWCCCSIFLWVYLFCVDLFWVGRCLFWERRCSRIVCTGRKFATSLIRRFCFVLWFVSILKFVWVYFYVWYLILMVSIYLFFCWFFCLIIWIWCGLNLF